MLVICFYYETVRIPVLMVWILMMENKSLLGKCYKAERRKTN